MSRALTRGFRSEETRLDCELMEFSVENLSEKERLFVCKIASRAEVAGSSCPSGRTDAARWHKPGKYRPHDARKSRLVRKTD